MSLQKICKLDDIDDGDARGFEVTSHQQLISIICIRQGQQIFAYKNSCPHTGVNLEWIADQFLDDTRQYLVCSTHGALFQIENGLCVSGPCQGDSLQRLSVQQQQHNIYIDTAVRSDG